MNTGPFIFLALLATDPSAAARHYSLKDIQGGWWSRCDDPAVEFYIKGDEYSGDFNGTYKLELSNDILIFRDGLIDGHSIDVTHKPLSFLIVRASADKLVLRRVSSPPASASQVWRLRSCK